MDVAGQGNIDEQIKKAPGPIPKPKNGETTKRVEIINFQPYFTWNIRPLPTMIPNSGPYGGFVSNKKKDKKSFNKETIYVEGIGHGAGQIVSLGAGPFLIGAAPLNENIGPALWIIVAIVLLLSAIMWAIIHLIGRACHDKLEQFNPKKRSKRFIDENETNFTDGIRRSYVTMNKNTTIDQFPMRPMTSEPQNSKTSLLFETKSQTKQMLSSGIIDRYTQSLHFSRNNSIKQPGLVSTPQNSVWSLLTSNTDNLSLGHLPFSSSSIYSQIIECHTMGLIFTISETGCPSTWTRQEGIQFQNFILTVLEECLEVFLVLQESLLIGKMKNNRHKKNFGEFVIQMWETSDGSLRTAIPYDWHEDLVTCEAVCTGRDKFLVIIRQGAVLVWNVESNRITGRVNLQNVQIWKGKHSIQLTKDLCSVVIMIFLPHTNATHIFIYDFDQLLRGASKYDYKLFSSQKTLFSLISDTSILIAGSTNGDVVYWDFSINTEKEVCKLNGESVQRILSSSNGDLTLIQCDFRLTIWLTRQWKKMSQIFLPSSNVCSMAFSVESESVSLLAVALDDESIQIFNAANGSVIRVLHATVPIMHMAFCRDNTTLIAMADRASHYRLFLFDIR